MRYAALCLRIDRDRLGAALGLADHRDQSGLAEHHLGELVHARRSRRTGRSDGFALHRIDRSDVVDDAILEVEAVGQRLAGFDQLR